MTFLKLACFLAFIYVFMALFAHEAQCQCWATSYGRGVGKIPSVCKNGEKQAGLCYKKCKKDYTGVGPLCW